MNIIRATIFPKSVARRLGNSPACSQTPVVNKSQMSNKSLPFLTIVDLYSDILTDPGKSLYCNKKHRAPKLPPFRKFDSTFYLTIHITILIEAVLMLVRNRQKNGHGLNACFGIKPFFTKTTIFYSLVKNFKNTVWGRHPLAPL